MTRLQHGAYLIPASGGEPTPLSWFMLLDGRGDGTGDGMRCRFTDGTEEALELGDVIDSRDEGVMYRLQYSDGVLRVFCRIGGRWRPHNWD